MKRTSKSASVIILSIFFIPSLVFAENIVKGPLDWPMHPGGPRIELSKGNAGYAYTKDNNWFADINDKTYGPYEEVYVSISGNIWAMKYKEIDGKKFASINGKIYGPYEDARVITQNNSWALEYKDGERWFRNINDKTYGPCESLYSSLATAGGVHLADNSWAFECKKGDQNYIVINEKEYGPYDNISDVLVLKNYWQYRYEKDDQESLNINGAIQAVEGETFMSSDSQGFVYGLDDKRSINIKGNVFGPFDYIQSSVISDAKWGFEYGYDYSETNRATKYVNINNKIYGPYETVYGLDIEGDNFGFKYSKDGKAFVIINDKEYGPFDFANVSVSEKSWGFNYSLDGKTYVNFMGKKYGPYDREYEVIYVSDNNWKMDSSKDTFFSGGAKSTIINGEIFGPYENTEAFLGSDCWAYNYQKDGKWYVTISQYVANNDDENNNVIEENKQTVDQNSQDNEIIENNSSTTIQNYFINISKYWFLTIPTAVVLIGGLSYLIYKKNKKSIEVEKSDVKKSDF